MPVPKCDGFLYKVKTGDNIVSVARKFNVKLADLIKANSNLYDPTNLEPGEDLCIPSGRSPGENDVKIKISFRT